MAKNVWKKIKFLILPIFLSCLLSFIFYFNYFQKQLIPAPLDIITSMYLPWLDMRRDIFPNGGPVKNPLPSDVVSLTLPLRNFSVNIMKSGQLPLWNPSILSGTPLLANFQSAAFNPINLLYLLKLDFIDVWSLQVILQPTLAFIFFYLFISLYQNRIIPRIFGSLIWAFNGFFSIWFQYNTVVFAAIYLPLVLFAATKIKNNYLWGLLLAISLSLSVYAGNPPITLIIFGTTLLYIIILYWKNLKLITISILFLLLSLGYSAPQLLIGLQSSSISIRENDDVAVKSNIKYLKPIKLITALIPDFFGNPSTRNTWENFPLYDNSTIYNGILPILLLLLSLKSYKKIKTKWLINYSYLLIGISLLIMLPSSFSNAIGSINLLGISSMVFTRFSILISFALATISAFVIELLIDKQISYRQFIYVIFISLLLIFIPFIIAIILNKYFTSITLIDYIWPIQTKTAYRNSLLPLIILILNFIFISLSYRFQKIFLLLTLFLLTFDLYRFFYKYNTFSSIDNYYPTSDITQFLTNNSFRFARESSQLIPSNMWLNYQNLQTPSGYDTTYSKTYGEFISKINGSNLKLTSNRYLEIDNFGSPLIDLLSVDYIVTTRKDKLGLSGTGTLTKSLQQNKYKITKDYGQYVVLKNTSNFGFIRPVKQVVYSQNNAQTNKYLDQINLNDIAIVEDNSLTSVNYSPKVQISNVNIESQQVTFKTTSSDSNPSFIVISQNYDLGWKLTIDDKTDKVYKTNHTFTGIVLPPGDHNVKLKYLPDIFILSLKIFIFSLAISTLLLIFIKSKNPPASS